MLTLVSSLKSVLLEIMVKISEHYHHTLSIAKHLAINLATMNLYIVFLTVSVFMHLARATLRFWRQK